MADERVLRWRSWPARPVRTAREADAGAGTAMLMGSEARQSLAWPVSGPERPARALGAATCVRSFRGLRATVDECSLERWAHAAHCPHRRAERPRARHTAWLYLAMERIAGEQLQATKLSSMAGRPVRRHRKAAAAGSKQAQAAPGSFR
jgi:hypothetical protein